MRDFLVANLSIEDTWVGNLLDGRADDIYKDFIAYNQSLAYRFNDELTYVLDHIETIKDLFKPDDPKIVHFNLQQEISIQSMVILDEFIEFSKVFDEKLADDFLWPRIGKRMKNIKPFFKFDREPMLKIMKEKFSA